MLKQPFGLFYIVDNINLTCIVTEYRLIISVLIFIADILVIGISIDLLIGEPLTNTTKF